MIVVAFRMVSSKCTYSHVSSDLNCKNANSIMVLVNLKFDTCLKLHVIELKTKKNKQTKREKKQIGFNSMVTGE